MERHIKAFEYIASELEGYTKLVAFDKKRLFYMQGDYVLFQCSKSCHNKTYDNKDLIIKMVNNTKNNKIPTNLIPRCPICHTPMTTNLRFNEFKKTLAPVTKKNANSATSSNGG